MAKPLVIVESPAKAKTLGRFLGSKYRVEASFGHIRDLPESAASVPKEIKEKDWGRMGVDVDSDFTPYYVVPAEKKKQVVIPVGFWWLSLVGSLLLLIYGLHRRDSVFIFAYLFTWIPYIRNLVIHYRHREALVACECGTRSPAIANYCSACGRKL